MVVGDGNSQNYPGVGQFFSEADSSFHVLSKDLLAIQRAGEDTLGFTADAVDDNIYHWRILFTLFAGVGLGCCQNDAAELQADLVALERLFNYRAVELEVRFTIDLYPFFPPQVKLVRPRFDGDIFLRIAQLACLHLSHWNPVTGVQEVLRSVQRTIASSGRIDLECAENDPWLHPEGAYTELEHLLLRLGILTEVAPRPTISQLPSSVVLVAEKNASDATGTDKNFWAKGTGYGHYGASGWDMDSFVAAEKEKDRLVADILVRIGTFLMPPSGLPDPGAATAAAAFEPPRQDVPVEGEETRLTMVRNSASIISASCLLPFLATKLENESLVDVSLHARLYSAVLELCRILAAWSHLAFLLCTKADDVASVPSECGRTLLSLLDALAQRADIAQKVGRKAPTGALSSPTAELAAGRLTREISAEAEYSLLSLIVATHAETRTAVAQALQSSSAASASKTAHSSEGSAPLSSESTYCRIMAALQYDETDVLSGFCYRSAALAATRGGAQTPAFLRRLARELADLTQSLPLSASSSAFIRVDAERMDCLQFLLSAPGNTPYSGLYLFDTFFPSQYPQVPPRVNLQTTGGGRVRFNPNLYDDGKVCLSLLGTWPGEAGETWNAKTSTFLQVVVSIQSLIFVPQPYFNEPGYKAEMGTPQGDSNSFRYNSNIRVQSVRYAMVEIIRHPPAGFEDVVHKHFKLRGEHLISQIEGWIAEEERHYASSKSQNASLAVTLQSQLEDLKVELARLADVEMAGGQKL